MYCYLLLQANTFQCVLATDGYESYVIFLYAHKRMQWSISDFDRLHAVAGISAGDGINFNTIPESQTAEIINVDETSNVGIPGVWMFQAGKSMLPVGMLLLKSKVQNICGTKLFRFSWFVSYPQMFFCELSVEQYIHIQVIGNCCEFFLSSNANEGI